jgi:hypothetical protein
MFKQEMYFWRYNQSSVYKEIHPQALTRNSLDPFPLSSGTGSRQTFKFPSVQHSYSIPGIEVWFTYNFQDANSCWNGSGHDNHITLMDDAHKQ